MKTVLAAVITLLSFSSMAMAEKPKPNPADFTVAVHVVFSHYITTVSSGYQQLDTVIDGMQVELECDSALGVLLPGDYKAKRIDPANGSNAFFPKHPDGFDIFRLYDLLMPDGTSREFYVIGLGPAAPIGAASQNH
jgi:hypothetical protein